MKYCEKEDLRFEVLKGVIMCDKLEHDYEEACAKEALTNLEIDNKKSFEGFSQGQGKHKDNTLVIIHRGMLQNGREWTKDNQGEK